MEHGGTTRIFLSKISGTYGIKVLKVDGLIMPQYERKMMEDVFLHCIFFGSVWLYNLRQPMAAV